MAYINIAFDSGQVAGWEQMLGAGRGTGLNRGDVEKKVSRKFCTMAAYRGITDAWQTQRTKRHLD